MKFEIKNRFTAATQFECELGEEYDSAMYSVKLGAAIMIAITASSNMRDADMSGADMRGADMSGADMRGADMSGADMSGADMSGADMRGADMSGADMSGADMSGADMRRADMRGANMRGADFGNGIAVTIPPVSLIGKYWPVWICDSHMRIGCQVHSHGAWESFSDNEIINMSDSAMVFWNANKKMLLTLCESQAQLAKAIKEPA